MVHYHLGHGGVPEVIAAASRQLGAAGIRHAILVESCGAAMPEDLPVHAVEGLGYGFAGDAADLLERLRRAAVEALGGAPDVWHFHNHPLGKNPAMAGVVARLAAQNERLLLQIHDLAEDGRAENAGCLRDCADRYPAGPRVHYAFLNSRDRDRFIAAGLPEPMAHLLPNPVVPRPLPAAPGGPPLLLYPVRGIRRKNLGEFLLLAALAPGEARAAVTRAPVNPQALAFHDGWRRFADQAGLRVEFDVVDRIAPGMGCGTGFDAWLGCATHLASTSVSEGFGMTFLDAAAFGRPLLGRNLPHLTRDHAAHGIRAGMFYDRLLVPMDWIDPRILDAHERAAVDAAWSAWRRTPPVMPPRGGEVDFGNLPEILQQRILCRLLESGALDVPLVECGGETRPAAAWLAGALACREPAARPDQLAPYSPHVYRERLAGIHRALMSSAPVARPPLDAERILDACLRPEHFHFLTSPPAVIRPEPDFMRFKAVVFDVYGTLLDAPAGGVKPDPAADPLLREILIRHGHVPPASPAAALHAAVMRYHAAAAAAHPEVDLRDLWRELLSLPSDADTTALVIETEAAWHPARLLPGAVETIGHLSGCGIPLGLLSNAQCNTPGSLGALARLFAADLTILSFEHGIAKPSRGLFGLLAGRLARRGIRPDETLYVGNDPLHDIEPAAACGFRTAWFSGHPESLRAGFCFPDFEIRGWGRA
jgi:FMN phosphatase YigB (HAD superfamily)